MLIIWSSLYGPLCAAACRSLKTCKWSTPCCCSSAIHGVFVYLLSNALWDFIAAKVLHFTLTLFRLFSALNFCKQNMQHFSAHTLWVLFEIFGRHIIYYFKDWYCSSSASDKRQLSICQRVNKFKKYIQLQHWFCKVAIAISCNRLSQCLFSFESDLWCCMQHSFSNFSNHIN